MSKRSIQCPAWLSGFFYQNNIILLFSESQVVSPHSHSQAKPKQYYIINLMIEFHN
jgi:hypothetical protein